MRPQLQPAPPHGLRPLTLGASVSICATVKDRPPNLIKGIRDIFVLPNPQDKPACCGKPPVRVPISSNIAFDLLSPPRAVRLWPRPMSGTAVPKTPVDHDCDLLGRKRDISPTPQSSHRVVHPITKTLSMQQRTESCFRGRVFLPLGAHAAEGERRRCCGINTPGHAQIVRRSQMLRNVVSYSFATRVTILS
jgi:hypothetical protein